MLRLTNTIAPHSYSIDNEFPFGELSPPPARKMPFHVPMSLAGKESRWVEVSIFRFHAQVENVPIHCIRKNLWQNVLFDNLIGFLPHQSLHHGPNF